MVYSLYRWLILLFKVIAKIHFQILNLHGIITFVIFNSHMCYNYYVILLYDCPQNLN
ncbi:protein of unknown function [Brevefilum fermentans]|uniref:Uncharacterized protein n=1 Tax=Candidatus Brevifilum fermentans TaxID=1986204 RepID=A0A1Y6K6S0_9CHLR|nr:protein of unknown function [Brevefilum fermentans]